MGRPKVLGYSERGMFNSIIFYLREHPEEISGFLSTLDIKDTFFEDDVVCYTFLNEQSFSDFGDCDWTIIAEKDKKKQVIFIEGKVKTYSGNYNIDKEYSKIEKNKKNKENKNYKGVSSNIFAQLYYKYLLTKLDGESVKGSLVGKSEKKIGKNPIVNKAYEKYIKDAAKFYYVAILPNELSSENFSKKFTALNLSMETKNIKCAYWGKIEEFFSKAEEVSKNFVYNKGQIY
ncbi:MAG: hypothetical protein LBO06_02405 [Bacteroidales bacterium]|jgi:hypothetical protein|nr:hypothetical protein [Bacteroidales bacterium]